jgi:hypothetical protein
VIREIRVERFDYSERFKSELRDLPPDVVEAVRDALKEL